MKSILFNKMDMKEKTYLKPGEKPPEGVQVKTGSRGGKYINDKGESGQKPKGEFSGLLWKNVTIHPQLTTDPYDKKGQTGKVVKEEGDVLTIKFDDGSIGKYDKTTVLGEESPGSEFPTSSTINSIKKDLKYAIDKGDYSDLEYSIQYGLYYLKSINHPKYKELKKLYEEGESVTMDEVAKKISNAMSIKNKPSPKVTSKDPLVWTTEINDDTYEDILEELCEINDNGLVTYKQNANFMKAMKKSQGYEIDVTDALKGVEDEYDLKLIRDLMYKVGIRQK